MLGSTNAKTKSLQNDFGDNKGAMAPATWYIAIFDGDPTAGGTELTGTGGVARKSVANTTAKWTVSAGQASNAASESHAASTGAWAADGTYAALMSASSGGDLWDVLPLTDPLIVAGAGVVITWDIGDYTVEYAA